MIELSNVNFSYDKNVPVLQNITLRETKPVIAGLWGRNGAGKTTLMKLLAGHERPDEGGVRIMGEEPYNNWQAVQKICFMQEDLPLSWLWTVRDTLLLARYYNPNWDLQLANRLLGIFELDQHKKVVKLSKGMKSALHYIIGLSSMAEITVLDEPINGLDAWMRKKLYETLLDSHADFPRLIMISTHHIEELQPLFETLAVMYRGRLLFYQSMEKVRERGIWLAGERAKVEKAILKQPVLEQISSGPIMKVLLDTVYTSELKRKAQEQGFTMEKANMQDYLLGLTANEEVLI
jgi:ABC-2 type transport system ATP-binding protein